MNFISHYYCTESYPIYYKFGSILPDLYPKFSTVFNQYLRNQNIKIANIEDEQLYQGILRHYTDDDFFHLHPLFIRFIHDTIEYFESNQILKSISRKNFVAHILYEMLLDHNIVSREPAILDRFYDDYHSIDIDVVMRFLELNIPKTDLNELFRANYLDFGKREYMRYYLDIHNISVGLYRVTGKYARWELTSEIERELYLFAVDVVSKYDIDQIMIK